MSASSGEPRRAAALKPALAAALAFLVAAGCGRWDGFIDPRLPAPDQPSACDDGLDDDEDGRADFPADPGCATADDPSELDPLVAPPCADGEDNDGDGRIDFDQDGDGVVDPEDDPGCLSASGDSELHVVLPQCADGVDNDGDQLTDLADPQCYGQNDTDEAN
jgi:hypothetical protein